MTTPESFVVQGEASESDEDDVSGHVIHSKMIRCNDKFSDFQ